MVFGIMNTKNKINMFFEFLVNLVEFLILFLNQTDPSNLLNKVVNSKDVFCVYIVFKN